MTCHLHSFYGHPVTDQDVHFPVFIREKTGYYLAFIYLVDEVQFSKSYQKEGIFLRNLQMPPIYAYIRKDANVLLEQDQHAESKKKDKNEALLQDDQRASDAKNKSLPQFDLFGTEQLSDGSIVELWKTKDGAIVKIYPDHIFKNMGNGR
jgi:hypothetical protein